MVTYISYGSHFLRKMPLGRVTSTSDASYGACGKKEDNRMYVCMYTYVCISYNTK